MAKKVFPIHLDVKHRRILEALAARDDISMAEAARRIIASYKIEVVAPESAPAEGLPPIAAAAAH